MEAFSRNGFEQNVYTSAKDCDDRLSHGGFCGKWKGRNLFPSSPDLMCVAHRELTNTFSGLLEGLR